MSCQPEPTVMQLYGRLKRHETYAWLYPWQAKELGLKTGDQFFGLPLLVLEKVPYIEEPRIAKPKRMHPAPPWVRKRQRA